MPRAQSAGVWAGVAALAALGVLCPGSVQAQSNTVAPADPFKEPLELIAKAKAAYAKVKDYSCNLIKRERLEGDLTPNHLLKLTVRKEPFSISMVWQEPKDLEGQEVVYVEGKHDGKMRVKPPGLLGSIGFISLATDDPRTRKASKHRITEAGLGSLIEQCEKGWEADRKRKEAQVKVGTYTFAKRRCTRVEVIHPKKAGKATKHHRNIVYFDQQTNLPIRVENYGWPEEEGKPGPLAECFSYVNLKLNITVPAEVFER